MEEQEQQISHPFEQYLRLRLLSGAVIPLFGDLILEQSWTNLSYLWAIVLCSFSLGASGCSEQSCAIGEIQSSRNDAYGFGDLKKITQMLTVNTACLFKAASRQWVIGLYNIWA